MATDPAIRDHQAWLGYLQPDGLVVSPAALVDSQVILDHNVAPLQQRFQTFVQEMEIRDQEMLAITDLGAFLREFLEWPEDCLVGLDAQHPVPEKLKVPLREFGETLEPSLAFRNPNAAEGQPEWLLLVQEHETGVDLDVPVESAMAGWAASHTRRFERLLRETQVPIGLLSNGSHLRLLYAPRGENAGTLTFPVTYMAEVAGRPILSALTTLLSKERLLSVPTEARLPALLKRSRDYQSRVSTALAGQVLDALYELLRGFQVANEHTKGELLREVLAKYPDQVYNGLLTTLMRLVFLLYAEDRGLMPGSDLYIRNYSVHGLFGKLRADAEQHPDTMDHRYGAWAQLVALFRSVFNGCGHKLMKMPTRHGHLFDPARFPFLSGGLDDNARLPLVADGVVQRVLEKLLILDGERISYRTLDVEQIGSVYETMMGFRLEVTRGRSIALKPAKSHGAPVPVDLDAILAMPGKDRGKWLREETDYDLPAKSADEVKAAENADQCLAALEKRIARNATPQPVPAGTMLLTPTDERRRSGSHYTPRSLTEPIVSKTLEPILKQLGENPTPDQILGLKICDPAMGSGAFLVEACRQVAVELVKAWAAHGYEPQLPPDEDIVLYARRMVAQRCLYGVDRNPMAVDLAKLSLWLATLARDHPFTFLDHSLRCGDSLVGLTKKQIAGFHWNPKGQQTFLEGLLRQKIERATRERRQILEAGDQMTPAAKRVKLVIAEDAVEPLRLVGDAAISAFFSADKDKKREERLIVLFAHVRDAHEQNRAEAALPLQAAVKVMRFGDKPVTPFHWEIEFPEVFAPENGGFDAVIGNPPFAGRTTAYEANGESYLDWLKQVHEGSHGNADLVAHFFRRAFALVRAEGCFGLLATKTIGQGDTRSTGLRYICRKGGIIYAARKRFKWPGTASVAVSVVNVAKGRVLGPYELDGRNVQRITPYLFHDGTEDDPARLLANEGKSFQGCVVVGMGFTFDDSDVKGVASPISQMDELIRRNPANAERIFPYIGGEEINDDPQQRHHRFIMNFGDLSEEDVRRQWPDLMAIVEAKVKPERVRSAATWSPDKAKRAERWWQYGRTAKDLYRALAGMNRALVCSQTSKYYAWAFKATNMVFGHTSIVFPFTSYGPFAVLESQCHLLWGQFFASTLEDRLRYIPSDCFETYPFPVNYEISASLERSGEEYYEFRASLMRGRSEGLTKTYNRFHDPNETSPELLRLRELHDAMDRAVLDAYGWTDIQPKCEFILDYEEHEDPSTELGAGEGGSSRRKKPWRYRWPDDIRDEVLARLLKLNAERAEEERRTGEAAAAEEAAKRPKRTKGGRKKKGGDTGSIGFKSPEL